VPVKIWKVSHGVRGDAGPTTITRVQGRPIVPGDRNYGAEEGIPEVLAELDVDEMERLTETEKFYNLVIQSYQDQAGGRRSTLVFAKNLVDVKNLIGVFETAGIQARAVTSKSPKVERQDNIASFERGDCKVVITVFALSEGYDAPHVSGPQMTRTLNRTH
jgi:superfamily II DNA or RNA helicase